MITYGSIEYYELVELRDKLNQRGYDKFGLTNLDKLRFEIDVKIEDIIANIKKDISQNFTDFKNNNMTETQEQILEGTVNMYNSTGELVPTKLFNQSDLDALVELGQIKIVDNPYSIGDDFFGLTGKKYPQSFKDIMEFRQLRDSLGDKEMAISLVNYITL